MANSKQRQYLLVDTARTASGNEVPQRVYWFDGRSWEVESVNLIMPVPKAKDGMTRFNISINKKKRISIRISAVGSSIRKHR